MRTSSGEEKHEQRHTRLPPLRVTLSAGLERSRTLHEVRVAMGFYAVPCNGCTLCCHGDAVRILPHEDARRWQTEPHPYMAGALMLAHKPNGDCVYLGDGGCTRQADKPQQCHEMDCRRIAQAVTKARAKKLDARGGMKIEIWRRGHELLRSNAKLNGAEPSGGASV